MMDVVCQSVMDQTEKLARHHSQRPVVKEVMGQVNGVELL